MKRVVAFCLSFVFLFSYIASYTCLDASAVMVSSKSNSFDIDNFDWTAQPSYIQDIVFTPISNFASSSSSSKTPTIIVRVSSSDVRVWVGFNFTVGYSSNNNDWYIVTLDKDTYPLCSLSQVYYARFNTSLSVLSDWKLCTFTTSSSGYVHYFSDKVLTDTSTTNYDFYVYGGFRVFASSDPADFPQLWDIAGSSSYSFALYEGLYNTSSSTYSYLPFAGIDSFYTGSGKVFVSWFTPKSAAQIQSETQGGILAQIKALPSKISGFFSSLGDRIGSFFTNLSNNIKGFFTSLGDRISGFFDNLFEKIKALFIPNSDDISSFVNDFKSWLQERLGFLYEIPDLFIQIFNKLISFNPKESDYTMTFPKLQAPEIVDGSVVWHNITDETVVDFSFINNKPFSTLYAFYKSFVWLAFCLMLGNLIYRKYNDFVGGSS